MEIQHRLSYGQQAHVGRQVASSTKIYSDITKVPFSEESAGAMNIPSNDHWKSWPERTSAQDRLVLKVI